MDRNRSLKEILGLVRERTLLGKAVHWLATPDDANAIVFHDPCSGLASDWVRSKQPFLRSGEPLNSKGVAFGGSVASLSCVLLAGSVLESESLEALACVGHASSGISILHLSYDSVKGWRHNIKSSSNARVTSAFSFSHGQCNETVLGGICHLAALPWKNFVGLDEEGFLLEIDAREGIVYRYEDHGIFDVDRILVRETARGRPLEIYLASSERVWKFESDTRFDPSRPAAMPELLRKGKVTELARESAEFAAVVEAPFNSQVFRFEQLEPGQTALWC